MSAQAIDWLAHYAADRLKPLTADIMQILPYEAEYLASLARVNPTEAAKGYANLQEASTHIPPDEPEAKIMPEKLRAIGDAMGAARGPAHNRKTSPDRVLYVYNSALGFAEVLRREYKAFRNPAVAWEVFRKAYPGCARGSFDFFFAVRGRPKREVARMAVERYTKVRSAAVLQHLKAARRNARINSVWREFFARPDCPFRLAAEMRPTPELRKFFETHRIVEDATRQ